MSGEILNLFLIIVPKRSSGVFSSSAGFFNIVQVFTARWKMVCFDNDVEICMPAGRLCECSGGGGGNSKWNLD